jgi:hypothetical protein
MLEQCKHEVSGLAFRSQEPRERPRLFIQRLLPPVLEQRKEPMALLKYVAQKCLAIRADDMANQ